MSDGSHAALISNLDDAVEHNVTLPFAWLNRNPGGTVMGNHTHAILRDVLAKVHPHLQPPPHCTSPATFSPTRCRGRAAEIERGWDCS